MSSVSPELQSSRRTSHLRWVIEPQASRRSILSVLNKLHSPLRRQVSEKATLCDCWLLAKPWKEWRSQSIPTLKFGRWPNNACGRSWFCICYIYLPLRWTWTHKNSWSIFLFVLVEPRLIKSNRRTSCLTPLHDTWPQWLDNLEMSNFLPMTDWSYEDGSLAQEIIVHVLLWRME